MRTCFTIPALAIGLFFSAQGLPAQFNSFTETLQGGSRIGVGLRDLDADRASALRLGSVTGVEVTIVEPGSPAEQAGIRAGDVLLSYNGESIVGAQQLGRLVGETPVGRKIKIEYFRDGKVTIAMTTTALRPSSRTMALNSIDFGSPGSEPFLMSSPFPMPHFSWTNPAIGIECEGLDSQTSQLAEFFGVKRGILVRAVAKDSAAAKSGLRAGDVIIQFDGHAVADPKEMIFYMRHEQHSMKALPLEVIREHKESTLKLTLPSDSQE